MVIDEKKEEDELHYYRNKLEEQVQATREILGNFQLVSRRSKITEGLAERYKEELSKHKEYLNHLLEQQSAALSAYKNRILVLDKERSDYKKAFKSLRDEYANYREQVREYVTQLQQKQSSGELEEYKVYTGKLEEYAKLQQEKKEFYKNELRQRVFNEKTLSEKESAYIQKIQEYKNLIARLGKNESNETPEQIEKQEEKQEAKQDIKQEENHEVKQDQKVEAKSEENQAEKQDQKQESNPEQVEKT